MSIVGLKYNKSIIGYADILLFFKSGDRDFIFRNMTRTGDMKHRCGYSSLLEQKTIKLLAVAVGLSLWGERALAAECTVNANQIISAQATSCTVSGTTYTPTVGWQYWLQVGQVGSSSRNAQVVVINDITATMTQSSGSNSYNTQGIYVTGLNSTLNAQNINLDMTAYQTGKNITKYGLVADTGGTIALNDLTLNMVHYQDWKNVIFPETGLGSYGILAGSSVNVGSNDNLSPSQFSTVVLDNADITITDGGRYVSYPVIAAIRAISVGGSSGNVVINDNLLVQVSGTYHMGIYVSGGESRVELNNSDITTEGNYSSAIKLGKLRKANEGTITSGTGKGGLISKGHMKLDTTAVTNTASVLLMHNDTSLNANFDTSSADIQSGATALHFTNLDTTGLTSLRGTSQNVTASFNDAVLSTTSNISSLIKVDAGQTYATLNLRGDKTKAIAANDGWLIEVDDSSAWSGNAASLTANISQGAFVQGLVTKGSVDSDLTINLSDSAVWFLAEKNGVFDSTFTELNITNDAALNVGYSFGLPTNYVLNGAVNNSNSGVIALSLPGSQQVGNILTINGDYVGGSTQNNAGKLSLNTVLGNDSSLTDKLMVNGLASGYTRVSVKNIGGLGDQTIQGIEVINTQGTTSDAFIQDGRIVAGSYDYSLVNQGSNWYLTSKFNEVIEPEPNPNSEDDKRMIRPEVGGYLSNLAQANTLFVTRLHDRLGETQYVDLLTGEKKVTSMWMRHVGGHNGFHDNSGQLKTTSNRYVVQLGGDLSQWSSDGLDRWHLGVMAGYANAHSKTDSLAKGYSSRGNIEGYSAGIYGTWYANQQDKSGAYVDSWLLYNWFDNTVKGDELESENYSSNGVTASVEGGYSFKIGERDGVSYWFQPKAQAVWMGVNADSRTESNGTRVQDEFTNNLMVRLGARAYMNGFASIDKEKERVFQPFVELNWIHNTHDFAIKMNDQRYRQSGTHNIGEAKLGVEGLLNRRLNLWGNVSQQIGGSGYSDTQAMLGIKYHF